MQTKAVSFLEISAIVQLLKIDWLNITGLVWGFSFVFYKAKGGITDSFNPTTRFHSNFVQIKFVLILMIFFRWTKTKWLGRFVWLLQNLVSKNKDSLVCIRDNLCAQWTTLCQFCSENYRFLRSNPIHCFTKYMGHLL